MDAAVAAYDTAQGSRLQQPVPSQPGLTEHDPVFKLDRGHPGGHKYVVSSAVWYPVDTGLFVTASYDHSVQVLRIQLQ